MNKCTWICNIHLNEWDVICGRLRNILFVSKWSMHQLLIEYPSIYELMACLDHEWEHAPLLQIWKEIWDGNGDSTAMPDTFTTVEVVSVFTRSLSMNELSYGVDL
ncbi:hypothetical protein L1987_11383 [Smallanthus sonchifolius]|uniref:Uncharacterized protein n=1 Tax=Smallanthus sonchifolius TaxID=185202 RepID=A0ACB9JCD0_9ASTR|nr:hypothetical protein L1987_11383 [Smallanthus sonchifolius]